MAHQELLALVKHCNCATKSGVDADYQDTSFKKLNLSLFLGSS